MSTHAEQSKRGELHSKLCCLLEEHGGDEVLWMLAQIIEDRDDGRGYVMHKTTGEMLDLKEAMVMP